MPKKRLLFANMQRLPWAALQRPTMSRGRQSAAFAAAPMMPARSYPSRCRRAFFNSCPCYSPTQTSVKAAPNAGNYYSAAASLSTSSTSLSQSDESFPDWWPRSNSIQKYIAFADHIAHVIVPNATEKEADDFKGILTCGDVVQWVLNAAKDRNQNVQPPSNIATQSQGDEKRLRIEDEWREGEAVSTTLKVLDPAFRHDPALLPQNVSDAQPNLAAAELIALGSVWHLPYSTTKSNIDRFDPSTGSKPARLNAGDFDKTVHPGDYFRVHFDPRRFVDTNLCDWGSADGIPSDSGKPGVIVARDDDAGYLIINKPPNIPVHARVDNLLENVASSVGRALWLEQRESIQSNANVGDDTCINATIMARNQTKMGERKGKNRKQKTEQLIYVATPQRLDQNTSGLLVVATKKSFASYFAKLLRTKTSGQLQQLSRESSSCGVHKAYRCLVCISPGTGASMAREVDRLKQFTMMKHFLEPSIRAPKRFVEAVPEDAENPGSWAECLLRITNVGEVCTVVGNAPSEQLATDLWGYGKPDECIAVVECEIELLTGRTHQIRGQLAASGFPLVGDVQYGGAVPNTSDLWKERCKGRAESFLDSECLALQCCALEFLDPLHTTKPDGTEKVKRSESWSSFRLDSAFWTPHVDHYLEESLGLSASEATTSSLFDEASLLKGDGGAVEETANDGSMQELPPRVILSQGSHKYVVVRAVLPDEKGNEQWFVRSASPEECGGPYHANVAEELLRQLHSLGYETTVMGGGRIDLVENEGFSHAHVFGFSYGFGKGDHEKVAALIETHTSAVATFDVSDGLY